MDKIDKVTRSRNMAAVRSANTMPEIIVRSTAHKLGLRFRLHSKRLPGKPDLVFPSRRIALFVHGCFWHRHDCPHGRQLPESNADFWREKLKRNAERDSEVQSLLIAEGWRPIIIWECQTKATDLPERIIREITNVDKKIVRKK
jgi:DNA mismatch endonuclease (patch repair protein)